VEPYLTVGQITTYIKETLELSPVLQDVWVMGEVSNLSRPPSGHVYFTLKDESANLNCVMWKSVADRAGRLLQTGNAVMAHGRVSVYEPRGTYQLYADALLSAGAGRLYQEFEALKERLRDEGLFDTARKRPLPAFPRRIGVVTSASGAAFRDILNVLGRRYPLAKVILSPTLVQGTEAPSQIIAALQALNERTDVDVIIVARGGGSMEELWAFNDENVARAIYASRVPVVSGVGHETDYTIADFVADVRAPTPSAAAELVVPDREELWGAVLSWRVHLAQLMEDRLESLSQSLQHQRQVLRHYSPQARIDTQRQQVDTWVHRLAMVLQGTLALQRSHLNGLFARLATLDPQATLDRGYAIVLDRPSGQVIHSVEQVSTGHGLDIRVSDGHFGASVE